MKLPKHTTNPDDIHESHADQLAPLEEMQSYPGPGGVHGAKVKIAAELIDGSSGKSLLRMDPLVLTILLGAVAWILFLTYKIYHFVPVE